MSTHSSKTVSSHRKLIRGFTLIELLVVISLIGILALVLLASLSNAKEQARLVKTKEEFLSIAEALELYVDNNNGAYPPDADRGLPSGIEKYLSGSTWPDAPWPGSVFDWDNWAPSDLSYPPFQQVYQISVRFCPEGQPEQCQFPNEPWASNFDYYSSVYYCISGPCRAHASQPVDHPAYCINC